jgi:hypothetical protein
MPVAKDKDEGPQGSKNLKVQLREVSKDNRDQSTAGVIIHAIMLCSHY